MMYVLGWVAIVALLIFTLGGVTMALRADQKDRKKR